MSLSTFRRAILIVVATIFVAVPATAWASHQYSDVPSSNDFHDDIDWISDMGITLGCGPSTFCPSENVTREQMAAFLYRLYEETVAPLESENAALNARVDALEAENAALDARVDTVESENATQDSRLDAIEAALAGGSSNVALAARVAELESILVGVSRAGSTIEMDGLNLQITNGQGSTASTNGLGNLIIGYNTDISNNETRTGSHYLIIGDENSYSSYGGLVAGKDNTVSAPWATVTGGSKNTASADYATVSGGKENQAVHTHSSIAGGRYNVASGAYSFVGGGASNQSWGQYSSILGGELNRVDGNYSTISGGYSNGSGTSYHTSILGGQDRSVSGQYSHYPN